MGARALFRANHALSTRDAYGACKHGLDVIASRFAAQAGLSYAWARIFFLYGPNEHPARLVASVARSLLSGEQARCSPGAQARDFLHVEDAARALVQLLVSDIQGAVNIASGQAVTVRELASRIGNLLGRRDLIDFGALPGPTDEPPVIRADVRRLTQEVGWHPQYNLDSGLHQTVEWWENAMGNRKRIRICMKLVIDTNRKTIVSDDGRESHEYPLYSREAFELISHLWLKVGWDQKYPYTFSWLGRPIIQLPEDLIRIQEVV